MRKGIHQLEVVITPEMIQAGKDELSSYNPDFETMDDAVIRIYREMQRAASIPRIECGPLAYDGTQKDALLQKFRLP